jgi:hypothetical protein
MRLDKLALILEHAKVALAMRVLVGAALARADFDQQSGLHREQAQGVVGIAKAVDAPAREDCLGLTQRPGPAAIVEFGNRTAALPWIVCVVRQGSAWCGRRDRRRHLRFPSAQSRKTPSSCQLARSRPPRLLSATGD